MKIKYKVLMLLCSISLYATPPQCRDYYQCENINELSRLHLASFKPNKNNSLEEIIKDINKMILSSATSTNEESGKLIRDVETITNLMDKLYKKVHGKNLNRNHKKVRESLTSIKKDTKKIQKSIVDIKKTLQENQEKTIQSYIDVKDILISKRNIYRKTGLVPAGQSCMDAGGICNKTYTILDSYAIFWKELEKLEQKMQDTIKYLKELDDSILLHMENKCSDRRKKCIYDIAPFDSNIGGLQVLLSNYQKTLADLLKYSKEFEFKGVSQ